MRLIAILLGLILISACTQSPLPPFNNERPIDDQLADMEEIAMRLEYGWETCGRLQNETIENYGMPWDVSSEINFRHFYFYKTKDDFDNNNFKGGLHFYYSTPRNNDDPCYSNVPWDISPILIPGIETPEF